MLDQLYPYIIQTVEALIRNRQLPQNVVTEEALLSNNWELVDTKESIITQEVYFLFEFRTIFMQMEIQVTRDRVTGINFIKDLNKKISYNK